MQPRRITEGRTIRQALASPLFGRSFTIRSRHFARPVGYAARVLAKGHSRGETSMGRTRNFVMGLVIAASALGGACASMGSRSISEVQTNPGKFADKTVTVEGVVTTSWGIPLVPFKVYRVSDGSGEMLVISDNSRLPGKNARVRVRGEVEEFGLFGGRSFGLHIREKSIKFL
jgi:hypothetical protein